MPLQGFKSITITEELYDRLAHYMYEHKTELARKGIYSISSLAVQKIDEFQEDQKKLRNLAGKIRTMPQVCRILVGA